MKVNRPQVVAHYTKDIVYQRLAPGILMELEERNPKDEKGNRRESITSCSPMTSDTPLLNVTSSRWSPSCSRRRRGGGSWIYSTVAFPDTGQHCGCHSCLTGQRDTVRAAVVAEIKAKR